MRVRPSRGSRALVATGAAALACTLAACGGSVAGSTAATVSSDDWDAVLAEADGQTVDWYYYGGDDRLNEVVEGTITARLADLGVTLNPVRVADTADALNKALGEQQAGRTSGGSVDAIWINGENFVTGVQAELWRCDWVQDLPNAQYVDLDDPAINTDFGVPIDGCESPWQQANSALVYDSAELGEADVVSVDSLLAWAKAHPGRFTYAAPPDFVGSMAVRTILYDTVGGVDELPAYDDDTYADVVAPLWARLNDVAPTLWRGGETYPNAFADVERLYADGEISAYLTYGPGVVGSQVSDGVFPDTTRETVLEGGNISNTSYLAIPANAADQAGALVLADVLMDPEIELAVYENAGIYPAVDLESLEPDLRRRFDDVTASASDSVLTPEELTVDAVPEITSDYSQRIEDDWRTEVLQR